MYPYPSKRKPISFLLLLFVSICLLSSITQAQLFDNNYSYELLAKAQPDEDFFGIGDPDNNYNPYLTTFNGTPKVNQAYVWGLTRAGENGNQLWFGTAPNVHCLVMGGYLGADQPQQTDCWACEFGESKFSSVLPGMIADWRPSRIFMYDLDNKVLVEKTPLNPLLASTLGLRSAGSLNGVVFLGGPSLLGGINLFAFNATNGSFIGAKSLPIQSSDPTAPGNIRKWLVVNDELYVGVGAGELSTSGAPGQIWKWTGDVSDPFQFEVIGNVVGTVAELAEHEGRIFISTWGGPTGIWMSPVVPAIGGLTNADMNSWQRVWGIEDYEVDPATLNTTGGGALASFGGYLFWGTMHVPMLSAGAQMQYFPPQNEIETVAAVLGTYRAISIFRGKNFGQENQHVDLLYGQANLPAYNPLENSWSISPNNMPNNMPLFGLSGFGNFMNNYTWTMQVYNNKLFVGTMDWSFLVGSSIASLLDINLPTSNLNNLEELIPLSFYENPQDLSQIPYLANIDVDLSQVDLSALDQYKNLLFTPRPEIIPPLGFGADLWVFDSPDQPAKPLSVDGIGNITSYGIRTMVASKTDLFLGMANPMNLCEKGGWELIKITDQQAVPTKNDGITDVENDIAPNEFYLAQNYPNPFNPNTTIKFSLPQAAEVQIEIYNSIGQLVDKLFDGQMSSGTHELNWNAVNMTSGIYYYKIKAGSNLEVRKMTLMK